MYDTHCLWIVLQRHMVPVTITLYAAFSAHCHGEFTSLILEFKEEDFM